MLTLQFIPYNEVKDLSSEQRINKLLAVVKQNKIILMEGRLEQKEEGELIQKTMEHISSSFKGIELCTVYPKKGEKFLNQFKGYMIKFLLGNRTGVTIIGPATVIKEIKRNPDKIELLTRDLKRKGR